MDTKAPTTTPEARNKAAHDFLQHSAVIHPGGATFAFDPIGGSHVEIMLEHEIVDGKKVHRAGNIIGPWGNLAYLDRGEQARRPEWDAHADVARKLATAAIGFVDGDPGFAHWWTALVHRPL